MSEKKIRVGYLPLYLKLYDDSDPHYRDPMVEYMHMLVKMLESTGLEVVLSDVCRVKAEFETAASLFNREEVDAVITQHLAYSPSLESIDALLSIKAPIVVLDTTPDYALLSSSAYKSGISENHGIHGVQDMTNLLRQRGCGYEICAGHALHSDVIARVAGLCRAAAVGKAFQSARVGTVGGSFHGMGDFFISPEDLKEKIGASVITMDQSSLAKYLDMVTKQDLEEEMAWDRANFNWNITDETAYEAAARSGLAVRKWAKDQRLTACTINFLTLDRFGMPKMPFVECSKMMTDGLGYAGEGDVLTAALVGAFRQHYPNTTFTEMFCPDWKENLILLSHMGECNLSLAKWKPVLRTVPFNYNTCGDTAAAYVCMRPGEAVYVNLAPMGEGFTLIVTPVNMLDAGLEAGAYRSSIQGWMKPCLPVDAFLKAFSMAGGTHHSALIYDADIGEIEAFGRMMGFEVVRV